MKFKYFRIMSLLLVVFLTACVPWGKERYFQETFYPMEENNFAAELLLLTDYSGEDPPSHPTNTLLIDIASQSPLEKESLETMTYEIENTDMEGEIKLGETVKIDRSSLSNYRIRKIIHEGWALNLRVTYENSYGSSNSELIKLTSNGPRAEYYRE